MQRTVKGDLRSFETELSEQRKTLYLEVGHQKELQSSLQATCAALERTHDADVGAVEKKILDLASDVRALKARVKAGDEEKEGVLTSSDLSKEVITALVTEVILADTIEKRNREAAEGAAALSKQQGVQAALHQEAEERMEQRIAERVRAQVEALRSDFKAEMAAMKSDMDAGEAKAEQVKAERVEEDDEWQARLEEEVDEMRRAASDNEEAQAAVISQLRMDLDRKSIEMDAVIKASTGRDIALQAEVTGLRGTLELFMKTHNEEQDRQSKDAKDMVTRESDSPVASPAVTLLQGEVLKVSGKVSEAQTALAKMHVRSMYLQDEIKAANDAAKEARGLVTELAVSIEKLEREQRVAQVTLPPNSILPSSAALTNLPLSAIPALTTDPNPNVA